MQLFNQEVHEQSEEENVEFYSNEEIISNKEILENETDKKYELQINSKEVEWEKDEEVKKNIEPSIEQENKNSIPQSDKQPINPKNEIVDDKINKKDIKHPETNNSISLKYEK